MKAVVLIVLSLVTTFLCLCSGDAHFTLKVVAGGSRGYSGDDCPATAAEFNLPTTVWADTLGDVYIVDYGKGVVRFINGSTGMINTVISTSFSHQFYGSVGDAGIVTTLDRPFSCKGDTLGTSLYVSDAYHIWKYDISSAMVSRYAGGGSESHGIVTDGELATEVLFPGSLEDFWLTTDGTIYVSPRYSFRLYKITSDDGRIHHVSGNGHAGYSGDGDVANSSSVRYEYSLSCYVDTVGDIFLGDYQNNRIRKIDATTTILTTYAGDGTIDTNIIPGGEATSFSLGGIRAIVGDHDGNLYISSGRQLVIYQVDISGRISIYIGTGGSKSDNISPTLGSSSRFIDISYPAGLWYDNTNDILYFVDESQRLIRKTVNASSSSFSSSFPLTASTPFGDKMNKEKLEEKKGDFISSVINLDVLKNESLSIFKEGEI
jgi:hypothetical protein